MNWALWFGLGGLVFSLLLYFYVKRQPAGDEGMRELAAAIQSGAMAFLRREYSVLVPFVLVVAAMLYWLIGPASAAAYVFGAACSILAGFLGMQAATRANVRTTEAARSSGLAKALRVAFS
ncbi:MAG: sodium/proton-translocating pyrophosphatase, partial [Gemmatimonadota bacterium]